MRRNNFTSASDRRWQRRYERIQQRREEELERRDRLGRDEAYETISVHDLFLRYTLRFKNGEYIIIDDLVPAFEPEPELKAGDSAELDSFLGSFLTPGA